jgi:hypothetical protein
MMNGLGLVLDQAPGNDRGKQHTQAQLDSKSSRSRKSK